jgi:hypothetical protein
MRSIDYPIRLTAEGIIKQKQKTHGIKTVRFSMHF